MRVLFVCTQNVCRSRVAEEVFRVLSWNVRGRGTHEARSAGTEPDVGGRAVTRTDLDWADAVCVMETAHEVFIRSRWPGHAGKVRVLAIPDVYQPDDANLRDLLTTHILALLSEAA